MQNFYEVRGLQVEKWLQERWCNCRQVSRKKRQILLLAVKPGPAPRPSAPKCQDCDRIFKPCVQTVRFSTFDPDAVALHVTGIYCMLGGIWGRGGGGVELAMYPCWIGKLELQAARACTLTRRQRWHDCTSDCTHVCACRPTMLYTGHAWPCTVSLST